MFFWWTYDSCITFNYYSFSRISQHYRFSQQETFVSGKWLSRRLSSLTLLNKEFLSRPYNWTSVRQLIQNWTSNMFVHVQKFNYWIAIWISRIWNLDRKFRYHQFHKKMDFFREILVQNSVSVHFEPNFMVILGSISSQIRICKARNFVEN